MKRHDPETRAEAVRMYLTGVPSHVVGEHFGASSSSVINWVRAAGEEVRPIGRNISTADRESPQVLTEHMGQWKPRGLVQVWEPVA